MGNPENPGLVMTLINEMDVKQLESTHCIKISRYESDNHVQGMAFRIPHDQIEKVLKDLDFREKGGYSRNVLNIHLIKDGEIKLVKGLAYVGRINNPHFKYLIWINVFQLLQKAKVQVV